MGGTIGTGGATGAAGTGGSAGIGTGGAAAGGAGGSVAGLCATYGWGSNTVAAIAPGGAFVAFATPSGNFEVRRWSDGTDLGINSGALGATAVAFSADGTLVGASTIDGVKIWRLSDGALLSTIPSLANSTMLAISSDGNVAVARTSSAVKLSRPGGVLTIPQTNTVGIGLSPDGTQVLTVDAMSAGANTTYVDSLWRVSDGQSIWSKNRGTFPVFSTAHVVFSPDGSKVAVGGGYPTMLRVSDGGAIYLTNEPLAFSADGTAFISVYDMARTYVLTRASDGATVRMFSVASTDRIMDGAFGSGLAMRVVLRSAIATELSQTLVEDGASQRSFSRINIASTVLSPDASLLAIGQSDGYLVMRDAATLAQLSSRGGGWLAFSPDSARATIVNPTAVGVYTRAGVTTPNTNPAFSLQTAALAVAFSPDGTLIGTGSSDHTAALWSTTNGALARTLWNINGHISSVRGIAFSPDGSVVATAGSDHIIKLWRTSDGTELKTISLGAIAEVGPLTFLPDGRLLMATPSSVEVWDVVAGTRLKSFSSGRSPVVSPDGSTLYVVNLNPGISRFSLSDYSDLGAIPLTATGSTPSSFQLTPNGVVKTTLDSAGVLRVWCTP